jgi:hypothetical protein
MKMIVESPKLNSIGMISGQKQQQQGYPPKAP